MNSNIINIYVQMLFKSHQIVIWNTGGENWSRQRKPVLRIRMVGPDPGFFFS